MHRSYKQHVKKISYFALALYSGLSAQTSLPCYGAERPSTVGVIEGCFNPDSSQAKHSLTQSTVDTFSKESPSRLRLNAWQGGHHANHVVSIIHHMSPESQIRLVDLAYEEGVKNKGTDEGKTIAAIHKAIDSKVDFINISRRISPDDNWNGAISSQMREALLKAKEAGIGVIKSAGNDIEYTGGVVKKDFLENQKYKLSDYTNSLNNLLQEMDGSMIMVVALGEDETDIAWDFSNRAWKAREYVVGAPGENILGDSAFNNMKIHMSGTSMATPYVTGLAAHIKQESQVTSQQALLCILETAHTDNVFQERLLGRGKVNVERARDAGASSRAIKG